MPASDTCRLCQAPALPAGISRGRRSGRLFSLHRCTGCGFAWVGDPWTDYAAIYDENYYRGEGSDPSVDYAFEYERPSETVRRAEWTGVWRVIRSVRPDARRWLDFGCGNAGLVRHVAANASAPKIAGFDTGAWADRARRDGLAVLEEAQLDEVEGQFDVVTAIEVIEHVVDPLMFLRQIRKMLRPGGLLFLTTGNADRAPRHLPDWSFVAPEIHVSYFTPRALALALEQTGFRAEFRGALPGFREIIRFKVLKGLGQRRRRLWHDLIPWTLVAQIVDRRFGVSAMPMGHAL